MASGKGGRLKIRTMRIVDSVLGVGVCALLTLWRRVGGEPAAAAPRRVAFLKLAEQGATVLALPALSAAIARFGRENVLFVAFDNNLPILEALALLPRQNLIAVSSRGLLPFARDYLRAVAVLRRARPLATVDMEFFARATAVMGFLSGAGVRVGFTGARGRKAPWRGDLLTHPVPLDPSRHVSRAFAALVEALPGGAEVPFGPLPRFRFGEGELLRVRGLLGEAFGEPGSPLILLNPNAGDILPQRRWPPERYLEVVRRLLQLHPRASIALCGAPEEAEAVEEMARRAGDPRCRSLAGKTSLRDLLVLFTLADLLVSNDSGPAHFAALAGLPTVVLFGPETPVLFAPLGERVTVLWANLPCSPCISAEGGRRSDCGENRCLLAITVGEVLAAAGRVLDSPPAWG